ncbi:YggS family pyridoxal phosphate-dependent enzyme [Rhodospirillaceae bacterium KN72]|uniref:Pyridoxal phosphate homeostasis protein n=1 Tax=Pacificispira spongiicola TaxID=2729598 RepID=A0A7Y0E0J1_9PROT|nr:YggS family pyridoxal phosphate-dependent enzyme [Pacificispira spongiicola]NMM45019.1 YggS family pyridoxal phosphate-dependent enzyme [Pacificispira spongiicola]
MTSTIDQYRHVMDQIADAARDADRSPDSVSLVAVSKTFDGPDIRPVLDAGHRLFGENRVQEAEGKWPELREAYPDTVLHLIGPLQSNKTKQAVALFDAIESIDRPKIAKAIARECDAQDKKLSVFIQVNIGEEPQKAGILPSDTDAFVREVRDDLGLDLKGLMCIPPVDRPAAPYFALLADMAARNGLSGLSMGMSADFETAIRFGATHVRVGSAIFGSRPKPQ